MKYFASSSNALARSLVNYRMLIPLIASLILFLQPLQGAGVAALKEQSFHNDSSAKPLVYNEMEDQGAPFVTFLVGGRKTIIDKSKIAAMVDVPASIPNQILDENAIAPLRISLKNMTEFINRFPQMKPILSKHVDTLNSHINNYDSGKVRYNGEWKSKDEYAAILKSHEEQMRVIKDEDAKKQKEKNAFEAEQLAKGLEKIDGLWVTKEKAIIIKENAEKVSLNIAKYNQIKNAVFARSGGNVTAKNLDEFCNLTKLAMKLYQDFEKTGESETATAVFLAWGNKLLEFKESGAIRDEELSIITERAGISLTEWEKIANSFLKKMETVK